MDLSNLIKEEFENSPAKIKTYNLRTVQKICGIPVMAYITQDFYLCVNTTSGKDIVMMTKKLDPEENLGKQIYDSLKSIKYSKKYDTFLDITKHEKESAVFSDEFLDLEKCCVCHEDTSARTDACGHALCTMCENMLKTNSCPVCRESLDPME